MDLDFPKLENIKNQRYEFSHYTKVTLEQRINMKNT